MARLNGHSRPGIGVPEHMAVGSGEDPHAVWRATDTRTGAYLGVVAREAPNMAAARHRAAELYGVPEMFVDVQKERR